MKKTLFFDLDETLYSENIGILKDIKNRIVVYVAEFLNVPLSQSLTICNNLKRRYGYVLKGLIINFNIDPQDFIDYIHNVNVEKYFSSDIKLKTILNSIDCEKYILTNSSKKYVLRILDELEITDEFLYIFDIQSLGYEYKSNEHTIKNFFDKNEFDVKKSYFIDNDLTNLYNAKSIGLKTIYVGHKSNVIADYSINNIYDIKEIDFYE